MQPYTIRVPYTWIGKDAVGKTVELLQLLSSRNPLIVTDSGIVRANLLDPVHHALSKAGYECAVFDQCLPDAPLNIITLCADKYKQEKCDLMIAVGGGSVIDTTKFASFLAASVDGSPDILTFGKSMDDCVAAAPKIFIPTTAGSGSEWSGAAVMTDSRDGLKKSIWNAWGQAVIIDPLMTENLPTTITAESGFDALSHGIEAYTSWKANLVSDMFAEKTIKLVIKNIRATVAKGPKHFMLRFEMAVAAALGMQAGSSASLGVAHPMSYPVAMKGHLSHGAGVAAMLPAVMAFNFPGNVDKYARLAGLLGVDTTGFSPTEAARSSVGAVRSLIEDIGLPKRLRDVGVEKSDLPGFVDYLFEYYPLGIEINPRDLDRSEALAIYESAW